MMIETANTIPLNIPIPNFINCESQELYAVILNDDEIECINNCDLN